MARFVTITNDNHNQRGKRRTTIARKTVVGSSTLFVLLAVLFCVAGLTYIVQVNNLATMGYEIKKMENELSGAKKENEKLKIKAAQLRSVYAINFDEGESKMEKPQQVSYIEIENPVAMK